MSPLYDLMLVLDPNVPDERHEEILKDVQSAIESRGSVVGIHDWGMRRLAYEIDHRQEGGYRLIQFEGDGDLVDQLGRSLRIADGVLRFRTIRLKPGSPPPPTPRPEQPRARQERSDVTVAARAAADAPARDDEEAPEATTPETEAPETTTPETEETEPEGEAAPAGEEAAE
jgi:small subunit ribosomal protein S6